MYLVNNQVFPPKMPAKGYTEDNVANTVLAITDDSLSLNKAAQQHGIPKQTLSDRMHGKGAKGDQVQLKSRISKTNKNRISQWILHQKSLGHAPSHNQIAKLLKLYLSNKTIIHVRGQGVKGHAGRGTRWFKITNSLY
jgi:phage/plasmid-associated DNA primase